MGGMIDIDVRQLEAERNRIALSRANERINQLERQSVTLSAEINLQRPVVEAAQGLVHLDVLFHAGELSKVSLRLDNAVRAYEAAKEQG